MVYSAEYHGQCKIWKIEKLDHEAVYRLGFNQYLNNQQGWINGLLLLMERQRYHFRTFIQNSTLKNKGLILALLTGDKAYFPLKQKNNFSGWESVTCWQFLAHTY